MFCGIITLQQRGGAMAGMGRRAFIKSAVAAAVAGAAGPADGVPRAGSPLAHAARRSGRFFGSAACADQINSLTALRDAVKADCHWVTPEFHMNWNCLQPSPERMRFGPADALCDLAQDSGIEVRGHSLLWELGTPNWAKAIVMDRRDWRDIAAHFRRVVPYFGERVRTWDVVNEAIDADGPGGLRNNTWLRAFGPDYVARAFDGVKILAPAARLAINDFGFEYANPTEERRRAAFLHLLEDLKRRGAPVDEVGLQAHLDLSKGPLQQESIARFVRDIAAMGYRIVITELDVLESGRAESVHKRDARIAREVTDYLDAVLPEPAVDGVMTWGMTDRFSWLQTTDQLKAVTRLPECLNRGLPYDACLGRKPLYRALVEAFNRHPRRDAGTVRSA